MALCTLSCQISDIIIIIDCYYSLLLTSFQLTCLQNTAYVRAAMSCCFFSLSFFFHVVVTETAQTQNDGWKTQDTVLICVLLFVCAVTTNYFVHNHRQYPLWKDSVCHPISEPMKALQGVRSLAKLSITESNTFITKCSGPPKSFIVQTTSW